MAEDDSGMNHRKEPQCEMCTCDLARLSDSFLGDSIMASEVYTRLLLPKGHGCPIWCPEPDENLPLPYREGGVRIGDVGRIDPDGGFDPLFNICARADHPINADGVPDGFEPILLESTDVKFRGNHHFRGSHIGSNPLEKRPNNVETDTGLERNA
jgi:hypothetical protein